MGASGIEPISNHIPLPIRHISPAFYQIHSYRKSGMFFGGSAFLTGAFLHCVSHGPRRIPTGENILIYCQAGARDSIKKL
jgi:hypothetical protein